MLLFINVLSVHEEQLIVKVSSNSLDVLSWTQSLRHFLNFFCQDLLKRRAFMSLIYSVGGELLMCCPSK